MESSSENRGRQDALSLLQWYIASGVDETIADSPLDWFSQSKDAASSAAPRQGGDTADRVTSRPRPRTTDPTASAEQIARQAAARAAACDSREELLDAIRNFDGCNLKKTAAHTVFADGNPDSDIMIIGDAPGVDDDRQGRPFAGESGQLLDRMFKAIDLEREKNLYITHLLPWRPPGNRKPTLEEITICRPFIERHIELFNPKLIILLGGTAAGSLLRTADGIPRLRGKWKTYDLKDASLPARPLYHPSYLLQQPKYKKETWHDLLEIKAKIKELDL